MQRKGKAAGGEPGSCASSGLLHARQGPGYREGGGEEALSMKQSSRDFLPLSSSWHRSHQPRGATSIKNKNPVPQSREPHAADGGHLALHGCASAASQKVLPDRAAPERQKPRDAVKSPAGKMQSTRGHTTVRLRNTEDSRGSSGQVEGRARLSAQEPP